MDFKIWLESNNIDLWRRLNVKVPLINEGIQAFTDVMSSFEYCPFVFKNFDVYNAEIANNLLDIPENTKIKNAHGKISINSIPRFITCIKLDGNCKNLESGGILIEFPPTFFDHDSKVLLKSIIEHECVHAYDFYRSEGELDVGTYKEFRFDMNTYTSKYHEARAYIQQLNTLVKEIGDRQRILDVLRYNESFGVDNIDFINFMDKYLRSIMQESQEDLAKKNREMGDSRRAAELIIKIYNLLLFKNFVS